MNIRNLVSALGVVAVAALGLAACAPSADTSGGSGDSGGDAASMSINLGRLGIGSDASIALAQKHGIYESHGITVNDTVVANPPAALAAVQSGQIDVAYSTVMSFLQARSQGVDVVAIASADGTGELEGGATDLAPLDQSGLFVNPASGITNEGQLAGKTVSVLARGGSLELGIVAAVEREGGDPSTINWVALDFASAVEALKGGTIDAAALVMPFTNEALNQGMVQLGSPVVELFGQGAVTAIWVSTPSIIESKRDAIDAFIAAQSEAADYCNSNIDEAMQQAKDITGIGLPVEEMTRVYWIPTLKPEQLETQMGQMHQYGFLPEPLDMSEASYQPAS